MAKSASPGKKRGRPASGRDTKYQREKTFRASHFERVPSKLRHNAKFSNAWYKAYHDIDFDSITTVQDMGYDYAKREDTPEAWEAFRDIYTDWTPW